ncbi:uncharacterized protein BXZ73DRAFT_108309, partial [Epithele typhae]|uniref:uncharacterized protein n=1 Tax=Epithele typhae TaxID=378194 RepID=UPI0020074DE9
SNESAPAPTVLSPLPSKLLSAAALTFIPSTPQRASSREPTTPPLTSSSNSSDSPFSSPTYNFHFPSLNSVSPADRKESRSLPPLLQKDESGFYVEVPDPDEAEADADADAGPGVTQSLNGTRSGTPRRPSAAFLPSFLTDGSPPSSRSRNSKTREMVDRLRSSTSSSSGRKAKKSDRSRKASGSKDTEHTTEPASHSKPEGEGWISAVSTSTVAPPPSQISHANAHGNGHKRGHGYKRSSGSSQSHASVSTAPSFSPSTTTASLSPPRTSPRLALDPSLPHRTRVPYCPGMYMGYQPFGVLPPVAPYGMPTPVFYDGKVKPVQWYVQSLRNKH